MQWKITTVKMLVNLESYITVVGKTRSKFGIGNIKYKITHFVKQKNKIYSP